MSESDATVLALSGGLALGAYQAGAWQAMESQGHAPGWVTGVSVGALNGAIIAGNAPGRRVDALRAFWFASADQDGGAWITASGGGPAIAWQRLRSTLSAVETLVAGRSGLFAPRLMQWLLPDRRPGLYSLDPLRRRLRDCVDFDRLNGSGLRFTISATDVETGEPVLFDTGRGDRVAEDHLLASCAFLPLFEPVEVGGRLLGDGGLRMNTLLDPVLAERSWQSLRLIIADILPMDGSRPESFGEALSRALDISIGAPARERLAAGQREHRLRELLAAAAHAGQLPPDVEREIRENLPRPVDVLVVEHHPDAMEAGVTKLFDYSRSTLERRWKAGEEAMRRALAAPVPPPGSGSFHVRRFA